MKRSSTSMARRVVGASLARLSLVATLLAGEMVSLGCGRGGALSTRRSAATAGQPGGLQFDGSSQYVTFGPAPKLGASQFTIEAWIKRTGAGAGANTGNGGLGSAIPLVAKGRGEAETPANLNMNYFLGIDVGTGKLAADFEDTGGGVNHPAIGNTAVTWDVWHHVAATYDGTTWRLYLDGVLDASLAVGAFTPEATSIQHASLASALTSTGLPSGYFAGVLDEVRIWNVVRTPEEIAAGKDQEIRVPAAGLIGRWGMDDGAGSTTVADSSGSDAAGSFVGAPSWVDGRVFPNTVPPAPVRGLAVAPADGAVSLTWAANAEADLAGYRVHRADAPPAAEGPVVSGPSLVTATSFGDSGLANGTTYYYAVVAVDLYGNASTASEISATPAALPPAANALQLDGSSQYVTFGPAPSLGASRFTLEAWINWTGGGAGTSTGNGGVTAIPLVAKGRAESEAPTYNMNYFLGIDATGKLVADFEEAGNGANHPISGSAAVTSNAWHHVAATYDGNTWRLYLDGVLDASLAVGAFSPEATSIQHASLGSALDSTGAAAGFFQGLLDEARIWNVARSGDEIRSSKDQEIASAPGLIGRWGMNQISGDPVDSAGSNAATLKGGPSYVAGYGFPADTAPPAPVQGLSATPGDGAVTLAWNANLEPDLAGYRVHRSTGSPAASGPVVSGADLLRATAFVDRTVANGTTYYYAVEAVDGSNNRSAASETSSTPAGVPSPANALQLDGSGQYVTFGPAPSLGASRFTLEAWVNWTGGGAGTSTGTGGVTAIPLVAKGRAEAETPANLNMNYFLGIDATGKLAADFEDTVNGTNHPITGNAAVTHDAWHHVAASYDGSTWRLYLDGALDASLVVGAFTPEATSIQHASLGSALNSTGVAAGAYQGLMDEVRIWRRARTAAEIQQGFAQEIESDPDLIGRWSMNQATGALKASAGIDGTLMGGPVYVPGLTFPVDVVVDPTPPAPPQGVQAAATRYAVDLTWTANGEQDLAGYRVLRSRQPGAATTGTPVSGAAAIPGTSFSDVNVGVGTTYYYAVVAVDRAGNASAASAEVSAAASEGDGDVVFVGAGDIAICGNAYYPQTGALVAGIAGHVFTIGDNSNEQGTPTQFATCYDPYWGVFKDRTRPSPGNHDYTTPGAAGYFAYFGDAAGPTDKGYYSYDIGTPPNQWHVVVLNSECNTSDGLWLKGGCDANSEQHRWLVADLAAAPTNNIIAMWHKPRFSSAGNNDFMAQLWQDLYDGGAELVLGGHWHVYERLAPMDVSGNLDLDFGVRQFVVGTAGAGPAGFGTPLPTSQVRNAGTYGVMKFTLRADSYDWQFIPIPGQTFTDAGTQAVHGRPYAAPEAPVVTGVSPSAAPTAGGTDVTISGTGFAIGATVTFDGLAAANVVFVSATQLTARAPAHASGAVTVAVRNPDGQTGTLPSAFTYVEPPTIASVSPTGGPVSGGTDLTIVGTGFAIGATVTFDGLAAANVVFVSATQLTARAPAHASGAVTVAVRNPDGQFATASFTYVAPPALDNLAPTSGSTAGGTAVTITGGGFLPGATVTFGPNPATDVAVVDASRIDVRAPAGAAGDAAVVVTNPDGQRSASATFTYRPPPRVLAIRPTSGSTLGGTMVTLDVADVLPGATVAFGGVAAPSVTLTGTTLAVETPAHAPGTVSVVVANPDGQSGALDLAYTFVAPPALAGISPAQGPAAGGTLVTLTGAGFASGMAVRFGASPAASVVVASATQASAVAPAGSGTVAVTVTNLDGQSATLASAYAYLALAPAVTSVSPSSGPLAGGTSLTIKGKNFADGATVTVGGLPATSVRVTNATWITAVTPAFPTAGTVQVTVRNPDGQAASLATAFTYVAPPATPVGLTATAASKKITLTWSPVVGATTYVVLRSATANGAYAQDATPTATTWVDNGLKPATTYCYEVQARNAAGTSSPSAYACATTR
jgi:fibronectin type 3 domain-containing protein